MVYPVVNLSHFDISLALKDTLDTIIDNIKLAIEDCPPELVSDLLKKWSLFSWWWSKFKRLNKLIESAAKFP